MHMIPRTAAVLAVAVANAACSSPERHADETGAAAPTVATYTATDFAFTGPAEIPAGAVTFRMNNEGSELHHAVLARLDSGRTMDEVLRFYADKADPLLREHPDFLTYLGGPGTGAPGSAMEATAVLEPGVYVLICYIGSRDGSLHFQKGMVAAVRVAPVESPAPAPAASVQLVLRDFEYQLSQPLGAGTHTLRVTNEGPQVHDAELVRLNEGVTLEEFFQAAEAGGAAPPPGQLVAGIGGLSPGQEAYWTVALEPGTYALVCFVPDRGDGAPHFAHGMVLQFEVG